MDNEQRRQFMTQYCEWRVLRKLRNTKVKIICNYWHRYDLIDWRHKFNNSITYTLHHDSQLYQADRLIVSRNADMQMFDMIPDALTFTDIC